MQVPQYLYRYRSLDGNSKEWVKDSILNSKYYLSSPNEFNDPFDCRPVFEFVGSNSELIKYLEHAAKKHEPTLNRQQRRDAARSFRGSPDLDPRRDENLKSFKLQYRQTVTSRIGILCLSSAPDDILLWSHYADSHKGVCLKFATTNTVFGTSQPVVYKTSRPSVNPLRHKPDQMLDHVFLTKSEHWKYEKEWRLISYEKGAGIYSVPDEALVEVILGAQCSEDDRTQVVEWIKARNHVTGLSEAIISEENFSLKIRKIELV